LWVDDLWVPERWDEDLCPDELLPLDPFSLLFVDATAATLSSIHTASSPNKTRFMPISVSIPGKFAPESARWQT